MTGRGISLVLRYALYPLLILFTAVILGCGNADEISSAEWLHGAWVLSHNPDDLDSDELFFTNDGIVHIYTENGRVIDGRYSLSNDILSLQLLTASKFVEVEFEASDDRSRLIYSTGAYYTKSLTGAKSR